MKELLDHQTFGIYIYLIINLHLLASASVYLEYAKKKKKHCREDERNLSKPLLVEDLS